MRKRRKARKAFLLKTAVRVVFIRGYRVVATWGTGRSSVPPLRRNGSIRRSISDVYRRDNTWRGRKSHKTRTEPPTGCFVTPDYKLINCWECRQLLETRRGVIKMCWTATYDRNRSLIKRIFKMYNVKGIKRDYEVVFNDGDKKLMDRVEYFVEDDMKKMRPKGRNWKWGSGKVEK